MTPHHAAVLEGVEFDPVAAAILGGLACQLRRRDGAGESFRHGEQRRHAATDGDVHDFLGRPDHELRDGSLNLLRDGHGVAGRVRGQHDRESVAGNARGQRILGQGRGREDVRHAHDELVPHLEPMQLIGHVHVIDVDVDDAAVEALRVLQSLVHLVEAAARVQAGHQVELRLDEAGCLAADVPCQKDVPCQEIRHRGQLVECECAYHAARVAHHRHAQHLAAREVVGAAAHLVDQQRPVLPLHPRDEMLLRLSPGFEEHGPRRRVRRVLQGHVLVGNAKDAQPALQAGRGRGQ